MGYREGPPLEICTHKNPMRIKIRHPEIREEDQHYNGSSQKIVRAVTMAIGTLAMSVALLRCSENSASAKANEIGAEARAELLAALPKNTDLPKAFVTELQCVASRAAQVCKNTQKTDQFEAEHCNSERLDQWAKSGGKNKAIKGLSTSAQYLVNPWNL